jgi:hypothetical protein
MSSRFKPPIVPAALFGIVLGLAGLGNAWRAAHEIWHMPALIGEALMALATMVWALLLVLFMLRWAFARAASLGEAHHPVQCCFTALATAPIRMLGHGDSGAIAVLAPYLFAGANIAVGLIAFWDFPPDRAAPLAPAGRTGPARCPRVTTNRNRDHFIWPSNLAAPLPLFDNRSSASRPPAA